MKTIRQSSLVFIILLASLFFNGCEEKAQQETSTLPVENTTELINAVEPEKKESSLTIAPPSSPSSQKSETTESENVENETAKEERTEETQQAPDRSDYTITGLQGKTYSITFDEDTLLVTPQEKPLLLLHLFDMYAPDSGAMTPYLDGLQKERLSDLVVIGIPINTPLNLQAITRWKEQHDARYFIASMDVSAFAKKITDHFEITTTPATLLYHNGKISIFYEGTTPVEMISHDIDETSK